MNSYLEGKSITHINPIGGIVAGQNKSYELWVQGSIITVNDEKSVKFIDNTISDAKRMNLNIKDYLRYELMENGIL